MRAVHMRSVSRPAGLQIVFKLNCVAGDANWCVQVIYTQSRVAAAERYCKLWPDSRRQSVQCAFFGWFQSDRS